MKYYQMCLKACIVLPLVSLISCQTPLVDKVLTESLSIETSQSEKTADISLTEQPIPHQEKAQSSGILEEEFSEDPYVEPLRPTLRPQEPSGKMFIDYAISKSPQAYIASPEEYASKGIQAGIVSVLLRDEYNLRLTDDGGALYSKTHPRAAAQLSDYLASIHTLGRYDSAGGMTEAEVLADHAAITRLYEGHIPLRYSLQTYTFAKETDLIPIINHLRTFDFVRSAGFVFLSAL